MSGELRKGFEALLKVHGQAWSFGGMGFRAIAQSGAYAARNFCDGDSAVKILRALSDEPAFANGFPQPGSRVYCGQTPRVAARSRRIDEDFLEIEITDTL